MRSYHAPPDTTEDPPPVPLAVGRVLQALRRAEAALAASDRRYFALATERDEWKADAELLADVLGSHLLDSGGDDDDAA